MLKNTWYVAGWSDELVQGQLLGRVYLNQPVVLFRQTDGSPVALSDLCPHRFAPLHMGKQIGNVIQCAYHGLEFGADGRCVRNPHGKSVPAGAKTRRYPLIERYDALWIWPGEGEADESLIPTEFAFLIEEQRAHNRGYIHAKANYLLLLDNLMDVSHALYLHAGSLTTEEMRDGYVPKCEMINGVVDSVIHQQGMTPPPFWAAALPPGTAKTDVRDLTRGHIPSLVMHEMCYSPVGMAPYSEGGVSTRSAHLYTPETDNTTHYFYALSRDFARDNAAVQLRIAEQLRAIFLSEDIPMIEAQQLLIGNRDLMGMRPALLSTDKASVLIRRHLADLIASESSAAAAECQPELVAG